MHAKKKQKKGVLSYFIPAYKTGARNVTGGGGASKSLVLYKNDEFWTTAEAKRRCQKWSTDR